MIRRTLLSVVLFFFASACGETMTVGSGGDSGSDATSSLRDSASTADVSTAGREGGATDASTGVGTCACTKSSVCSKRMGSGAKQTCQSIGPAGPGFLCPSGYSLGPCPSADLYGCCVETTSGDGGPTHHATCYYSSSLDKSAYTNCITQDYDGLPYAWQGCPPCD
jgi:hypothetical protein